MDVTKLFTIQNCFKTDTFSFSLHAGSEMIKASGRILQTGFACVNAFTVLFTVQAAAVSGAERAFASDCIHFTVSDPS
jgi:hypothetical protein